MHLHVSSAMCSGIVTLIGGRPVHRLREDLLMMNIWCSKHVEAWNKLIVKQKFCASNWLLTKINILRCTVSKTSKNKNFLSSEASEMFLGPNQTTIRGVLRAVSPSVKRRKHDALLSALAVYPTTFCNLPRYLELERLLPWTADIFTEWHTKFLHILPSVYSILWFADVVSWRVQTLVHLKRSLLSASEISVDGITERTASMFCCSWSLSVQQLLLYTSFFNMPHK